jgi:glutamate:Na+ symporter, ESS family
MMEQWSIILYFLLIAALILVGKFVRTKAPILNKVVMPSALLAGMIGLIISLVLAPLLSNEVVIFMDENGKYIEEVGFTLSNSDIITKETLNLALSEESIKRIESLIKEDFLNRDVINFYENNGSYYALLSKKVTLFDTNVLENIVYHALAIGFLALALKRVPEKPKRTFWTTGMLITSTYAIQAFIGITLVFLFFQDRFIGSGMLVALGFGQGPGLAMSIGSGWSPYLDNYGTVLGASYAFLGFVFGGTVGVYLINRISKRRGQIKPTYQDETSQKASVDIDMVKEISILDGFTQQFVIIGSIYLIVYVTLLLIHQALMPLGNIGNTIFGLFRGFNFIIAILYGLLYKSVLSKLESRGKNVRFMTNNYMLSNIASFAFNIMITGSVLAITLAFLETFGVQLIVTSIFAGVITLVYLIVMSKRIYDKHHEEYTVGLFGMLTGVASTGLALLKGIDPNLETPVAEEMVLGSGTAILMALPLFVLLFIPSFTVGSESENLFKWITYLGILAYILLFIGMIIFRTRSKK